MGTPSAPKASISALTGAWQPKSTIVPAQSKITRSKRLLRLMLPLQISLLSIPRRSQNPWMRRWLRGVDKSRPIGSRCVGTDPALKDRRRLDPERRAKLVEDKRIDGVVR